MIVQVFIPIEEALYNKVMEHKKLKLKDVEMLKEEVDRIASVLYLFANAISENYDYSHAMTLHIVM